MSNYNSTRSTIKRKKPKEHKTKSDRERETDTNDFYFDCSQTEVTHQQQDGFTVIWNLLKIGILLVFEGPWVE